MASTDIDTVITQAKEYSGELLDEARILVNTANTIAAGRAFVNERELVWESITDDDDSFIDSDKPGAFEGVYIDPDKSGLEDLSILEPYFPNIPDFPTAPDELDTSGLFRFTAPAWNIGDFTEAAPNVNTNLTFPAAPSVNLPGTPDSADDTLTVPDLSVPVFDDVLDATAPTELDVTGRIADEFTVTREQLAVAADSYANNWMVQHCPNYYSGMAALEARITECLAGGSAMNEEWEQANYDRALIRSNDEQHRSQLALSQDYARRGFAIPPGAVMAGLSRMRHESARNMADVSANIANERARIELQHLQFGMQTSAMLRQHFSSAMQNYMQLIFTANGQALQYASEIGRWAAELFNQRVQIYNLEIARYQSEAQVYAVRLESAFAVMRKFEAEIEAEKLKIEVDRSAIALYEAQINGERAKVEIYNSQLEAIRTQLQAEGQKVDVFESQVRAYSARISGKEAEYNAYRAAIQGDAARVDAYQSEVQAYSSQVQAAGTKTDAERSISQSIIDYNRSLIDQRDSNIKRYAAELQAEGSRFGSEVEVHKVALAQYTTQVEAKLRLITTNYQRDQLALQAAVARVEQNMRAQTTNVDSFLKSIESQASISHSGASIIGGMASSSLTTNNTILTSEE